MTRWRLTASGASPPPPRVASGIALAFGAALATGVVVGTVLVQLAPHHGPTAVDVRVLRWFTARRTPDLAHVARRVTWLASAPVAATVALVAAAVLLLARHVRAALFVLVAVAGAACVNAIAKWVIGRDPPPRAIRAGHSHASSFPSGHSTEAAAMFLALGMVVVAVTHARTLHVVTVVVAALLVGAVGVSRLLLGSTGAPMCSRGGRSVRSGRSVSRPRSASSCAIDNRVDFRAGVRHGEKVNFVDQCVPTDTSTDTSTRRPSMPVIPAPAAPTHTLGTTRFTSLATPSRGTTDTAVWQVEMEPDTPAVPHSLTREEVFVVLAGVASARIGDRVELARPGDAIVVPAGVPFALENGGEGVLRLVCCLPVGGQGCLEDGSVFTPPWAE